MGRRFLAGDESARKPLGVARRRAGLHQRVDAGMRLARVGGYGEVIFLGLLDVLRVKGSYAWVHEVGHGTFCNHGKDAHLRNCLPYKTSRLILAKDYIAVPWEPTK